MECHTPLEKGRLQFESALGAGGRPFLPSFVKGLPERWKGSVSRNITLASGPRAWAAGAPPRSSAPSHQGIGRDGRRMQEPMAFAWYAGLRDEDLDALVAYLRTLPRAAALIGEGASPDSRRLKAAIQETVAGRKAPFVQAPFRAPVTSAAPCARRTWSRARPSDPS